MNKEQTQQMNVKQAIENFEKRMSAMSGLPMSEAEADEIIEADRIALKLLRKQREWEMVCKASCLDGDLKVEVLAEALAEAARNVFGQGGVCFRSPAPPYDPDYQGLKHKYNVYKAEDGSRVESCFVLRPDKDPAAVAALRAYAGATDNALLAADIWGWVGQPKPLTLDELMALDGEPVFLEVANGEWGLVNTRDGIICFSGGGDISISHAVGCAYRTKPEQNREDVHENPD